MTQCHHVSPDGVSCNRNVLHMQHWGPEGAKWPANIDPAHDLLMMAQVSTIIGQARRSNNVMEWPEDEQKIYRETFWESFTAATEYMQQYVDMKTAEKIWDLMRDV